MKTSSYYEINGLGFEVTRLVAFGVSYLAPTQQTPEYFTVVLRLVGVPEAVVIPFQDKEERNKAYAELKEFLETL